MKTRGCLLHNKTTKIFSKLFFYNLSNCFGLFTLFFSECLKENNALYSTDLLHKKVGGKQIY